MLQAVSGLLWVCFGQNRDVATFVLTVLTPFLEREKLLINSICSKGKKGTTPETPFTDIDQISTAMFIYQNKAYAAIDFDEKIDFSAKTLRCKGDTLS